MPRSGPSAAAKADRWGLAEGLDVVRGSLHLGIHSEPELHAHWPAQLARLRAIIAGQPQP